MSLAAWRQNIRRCHSRYAGGKDAGELLAREFKMRISPCTEIENVCNGEIVLHNFI